MSYKSGLSKIENIPNDPLKLFEIFLSDWQTAHPGIPPTMNLATIHRDNTVLNRTVLYRGLAKNGFLFVTETDSRKYEDIKQNPNVAVTFLFLHEKGGSFIHRQIRINGITELSDPEEVEQLWNQEPLFAKIRSYICQSGKVVCWNDLKKKHDKFLEDAKNGLKLEKSKTYVAFKIVPQVIDFYYAEPNSICDRVLYEKNSNCWTNKRICG